MIANSPTASGRDCNAKGAFSWRVRLRMGSLAPQGIADGILHFALNLTSFAFACELPVAGYLSNDFFHLALGLLSTRIDLCPP
jgi:hypothetical protein